MKPAIVQETAIREPVDGAHRSVDTPVVLLASTCAWPWTPKLAITLADEPCVVVALAPAGHPLTMAAAVARRFRYRATRPLRSLARAIASASPDLIIACDDRAVEHLHRLHAQTHDPAVRTLIERSLGRPDGYGATTSRETLMSLAADLGVRTPATQPLRAASDLTFWAQTQPFPWVLKVDGSWGGLGVRIVSNLAAAERAYRELSRPINPLYALRRLLLARDLFWLTPWLHQPPRRVCVQAYVEGRPANCVIAAWTGEALAGAGMIVLSSDGETGPACIIRVAKDPAMLDAGGRIVHALGLSGMIGFDFVIERSSGRPVLLEMNPRATPIAHLRLGEGRDPVGALIARSQGRATPVRPSVTPHDTIALFPQANLQHRGDPVLAAAFQDTPVSDPRLVRALLRRRAPKRSPGALAAGWAELS